MPSFIDQAPPLVTTLAKIAHLKGEFSESEILDSADASLVETDYDNWNGGTTLYTLMLEVPVNVYAEFDEQREKLEQSILNRVQQLTRVHSNTHISQVVITPTLVEQSRPKEMTQAEGEIEQEEIPRFWQPGYFRLFITHIAPRKQEAHRLKEALASYQIAAFVAHDDIEPTREWQAEIQSALRTMDGLTAMVFPGFIESRWCDQEVGFSMGRGKLVIPLMIGADPHGFMGKAQGLQCKGLNAAAVAEKLAHILVQHPLSSPRMTEVLVERLVNSTSWSSSRRTLGVIEKAATLTESQASRLLHAIEQNSEVSDAYGVPERIQALVTRTLASNSK